MTRAALSWPATAAGPAPMPGDVVWGWVGPLAHRRCSPACCASGGSAPRSVVFDETYYAKDAYALLKYGVEQNFVKGDDKTKDLANQRILAGDFNDVFAGSPVVRRAPARRQVGDRASASGCSA